MNAIRRALVAVIFLCLLPGLSSQVRSFRLGEHDFLLDGKPFRIMAGELHFQRIPREYWKDRLLKAKAMGLNTVCTYVFWNILEPEPGQWDFPGGNDLAAFIRTARGWALGHRPARPVRLRRMGFRRPADLASPDARTSRSAARTRATSPPANRTSGRWPRSSAPSRSTAAARS